MALDLIDWGPINMIQAIRRIHWREIQKSRTAARGTMTRAVKDWRMINNVVTRHWCVRGVARVRMSINNLTWEEITRRVNTELQS